MLNLNFNPFPLLTTERLVLRQLTTADAETILKLRSDENINKYLDRPAAKTLMDAQNFIDKIVQFIANNESAYWVLCLKNNPALIGTICYYNIDVENDVAELGYELATAFQGQGIMREAIAEVINFGFSKMLLKLITAFPRYDNQSSIKLLEKTGFIRMENGGDEKSENDSNHINFGLTNINWKKNS